jgi:hypothetical protein
MMVRWESPGDFHSEQNRQPGDPGYHGGRWDPNYKPPKRPGCPPVAFAAVTLVWLLWRRLR